MAELTAHTNGNNNVTIQIVGDNNSVGMGPVLGLRPWQEMVNRTVEKSIDILSARAEAVPVVGRDEDLDFLSEWLGGGGIRVTAVVGQGGSGKTRLALEFLKTRLPQGWQGGFMDSLGADWFKSSGCRFRWRKNTLVVVDYAALQGGVLKDWFERLGRQARAGVEHSLRILLLERHGEVGSGWYGELTDRMGDGESARKLFHPNEPRRIAPLDSLEVRRTVLAAGLARLGQLEMEEGGEAANVLLQMPLVGEDALFDQRLGRAEWADPLLLLMAAVVASQNGVHDALAMTRHGVALWVAEREVDRLKRGLRSQAAKKLLVHLYGCVILCRQLDMDEACDVAAAEFARLKTEYPDGGPGAAVDELALRVGLTKVRRDGGTELAVLARLQPDLLAEAFLLVSKLQKETALRMAHVAGKSRDVAQMLIFTARDFGESDPRPVEWLKTIVARGEGEIDVLIEIEAALPVQTLAMKQLAVEVGKLLVVWARNKFAEDQTVGAANRLALYLNNLSNCESAVGDRAGALRSIREAVEIRRGLYGLNADAFAADLAMSLNNLSLRESDVGDRAGALRSIRESVGIYRGLYGLNADAFAADLASSLNNLSLRESAVGDLAGALGSIREAVELYRGLYGLNADAFAADLASSLNNLSRCESAVGDRDGALVSIRESVALYRGLYGLNADAFTADLAMSLNNLSTCESAVGDRGGALGSIREAVQIWRVLYGLNADAFASDLARSLSVLGDRLDESGEKGAARDAAAESLQVLRPVYEAFPQAVKGLARVTVVDYARRSKELGLEMEMEVVGPYLGLFAGGAEESKD